MSTRKNEVSQKNNLAAYQRWHQILAEPIPLEAVLLSNDRNEIMPMWYYQYVEGHRPDLLGLFPLIVTAPAYADVGRLLDQALASERPVYLIKPMAGLNLKADLIPEGTLFRVEPVDTPPAYPVNVILPEIVIESAPNQVERETIAALGFDLSSEQIKAGAVITISLHWQAIQELSIDYTSYVHLVDSDGRSITQSDHRPGGDFYPSSYWQVGEILRDHHTLTIPANTPPGVYQLRTGMYYQPQPGVIVGMGNGTEIGQLRISK